MSLPIRRLPLEEKRAYFRRAYRKWAERHPEAVKEKNRRRKLKVACLLLLSLALTACGTKSHDRQQSQQQPGTQKTTDDGPAVERVPPKGCNG